MDMKMLDTFGKRLGYYDDLDEAIKARKQAEIKYFGEYRNKPKC